MRKIDGVRVHHKEERWGESSPLEKKRWRDREKSDCHEKKGDGVRVDHEKNSNGVRVYHEKERCGETLP